jgi:hypothetical protein
LHKIFDSTPLLIRPLCNQYAPLAAPSLRLPETTWSTLILFFIAILKDINASELYS